MQASDKENAACDGRAARLLTGGKGAKMAVEEDGDGAAQDRWARHCHSVLGAVGAASILKASSCS